MTNTSLDIVYCDDDLVAIDKPAWSVVHRTRGADDALCLAPALTEQIGASVFPVHRLDRQTSGVLLFGRSREAARRLCDEFREGRVRKTYLALCRGVVPEPFTVDHPVDEDGVKRSARTHVEPVEYFRDRYSLVRARIDTGRRHQIRYHLRHVNHPLVVDVTYGNGKLNRFFRETFGLARLFLHASALCVLHPTDARELNVSAPLPAELESVLDRLRRYEGPVV